MRSITLTPRPLYPQITLTPRPLYPHETPEAGDLFFQRGSSFIAAAIRFSTGSDINHTGVILGHDGAGLYTVAEANAPGFEIAPKQNFTGYVVRVSDEPIVRASVAFAASMLAREGRRYDYLAIARFAGIVMRRSRPRSLAGKVLLGVPALAVRGFGAALLWVLPAESPRRVICSGAVRMLLRRVAGEGDWSNALPVRDDETSPADLLAALLGRRRW